MEPLVEKQKQKTRRAFIQDSTEQQASKGSCPFALQEFCGRCKPRAIIILSAQGHTAGGREGERRLGEKAVVGKEVLPEAGKRSQSPSAGVRVDGGR